MGICLVCKEMMKIVIACSCIAFFYLHHGRRLNLAALSWVVPSGNLLYIGYKVLGHWRR